MMANIRQFSNLAFICVAIVLGIFIPEFGSYIQPLITPLIIFLIYTLFRDLQLMEITNISNVRLVAIATIFSYVVLPIIGGQVLKLIVPEKIFVGFVILLVAPTTAVSAVWTRFANGDVQLATAVTVGSIIISPLVTPLLLTHFIGSQTTVPAFAILTQLMTVIIGGILLTAIIPSSVISDQIVNYGSIMSLLAIIYASTTQVNFERVDITNILVICSAAAIILVFGIIAFVLVKHFFMMSYSQSIALFYSSNMKNLGIALLISSSAYPDSLIIVAILIYFLVQQLVVAFISDYIS